jgi:hypothetical protein
LADVNPSFAAYDLSDPDQIAWLRAWFEGRLEALKERVLLFNQLRAIQKGANERISIFEQMKTILDGILDELKEFNKLIPYLTLPDDSYNPKKVAEDKVIKLLRTGLKLEIDSGYILGYEDEFEPLWKVWADIAREFGLDNLYKEIGGKLLDDYEKMITEIYRGSRDGLDKLKRIKELRSKIETGFSN